MVFNVVCINIVHDNIDIYRLCAGKCKKRDRPPEGTFGWLKKSGTRMQLLIQSSALENIDTILVLYPCWCLIQVELGYEEAECGPTSNFVGNHMTQGAIDLVQAELKRKPNSYPHISFAPERILNPDEVLPARLPAPETKSTEKSQYPGKTHGGCAKQLRQVDWSEDEKYVTVLLERPFTEELSTATWLRADITESSIKLQYHIKKKRHASEELVYLFHVPKLHANIDAENCGLYLGSGSLEEIKSSSNILKLGPTCTVSHSDPSTLICLVLAKSSPGNLWKQLNSVKDESNLKIMERIEHQQPDLDRLKSFVRHQLRS